VIAVALPARKPEAPVPNEDKKTALEEKVDHLQSDVSDLKKDVHHLQSDVSDLKKDVRRLDEKTDNYHADLRDRIDANHADTQTKFEKLRDRMDANHVESVKAIASLMAMQKTFMWLVGIMLTAASVAGGLVAKSHFSPDQPRVAVAESRAASTDTKAQKSPNE
jgi:hypothetical protein